MAIEFGFADASGVFPDKLSSLLAVASSTRPFPKRDLTPPVVAMPMLQAHCPALLAPLSMWLTTRGRSLEQIVEELAPYLIGWRGYFGFCQPPLVLTKLGAWIRRRLRSYLWRQWRNGHNRFKELRRRGVSKFHAAVAASSPTGCWRMSSRPSVQNALRNHVFHDLGLPRLYVAAEA